MTMKRQLFTTQLEIHVLYCILQLQAILAFFSREYMQLTFLVPTVRTSAHL